MSRSERPSQQLKQPSTQQYHRPQGSMQPSRKPAGILQMPGLPRFHPAVYQSPNSSTTSSPRTRQAELRNPLSPQLHQRQRSGPQQQLYQHQRDLIATVTRNPAAGLASHDTPKAPSLHPAGSPGPATPLNLESEADYLTAGMVGDGSPRELVDKIIRNEKERRSGLSSGPVSPAVSPAGGRG